MPQDSVSLSRFSAVFCSFRRFCVSRITLPACAFFASSRSFWRFCSLPVQLLLRIVAPVWEKTLSSGVFLPRFFPAVSRSFFICVSSRPISKVIRSHAHFFAASPDKVSPCSFQSSPDCRVRSHPLIHFFQRDMGNFRGISHSFLAARAPDGPAGEVRNVKIPSSSFAVFSPDHPACLNHVDGFIH